MYMKEFEKLLKAFANKKRLEIIALLLAQRRMTLREIRKGLNLAYRSTSKHLRNLYERDIVDREFVHGEAVYYLSKTLSATSKKIIELLSDEIGKG